MGTARALVPGAGSWPARICRISKQYRLFSMVVASCSSFGWSVTDEPQGGRAPAQRVGETHSHSKVHGTLVFSAARYTRDMKSVADRHRKDDAAALAILSPAERVELSFRLGDEDLEVFRRAHNLDREEALELLRRARQAGRTPWSCAEGSG